MAIEVLRREPTRWPTLTALLGPQLAEIERLRAENEAFRKVAKRGVKALEDHDEWYLEELRDDLIAVLLATAALGGPAGLYLRRMVSALETVDLRAKWRHERRRKAIQHLRSFRGSGSSREVEG